LVCRNLKRFNIDIYHILSPDEIEKNSQSEERLLKLFSLEQNELFLGKEDLLEEAYNRQGELIAYTERGGAQDD
jgi:hypothetical protein